MEKDYVKFLGTLPDYQQNTDGDYNTYRYWELNGKPKTFNDAVKIGMYTLNDSDGLYHARSVAYNRETDEYEFMKTPNHPTIQKEVDWYESDDAESFRKNYKLDKSGDVWKYVRRNKTSDWLEKLVNKNK